MRVRDSERQVALLVATLDNVPGRMAWIRGLAADPARRQIVPRLSTKLHGLLVRLRHDAWMRTQQALELAEDLETGGDMARARSMRRAAMRVRTSLDAYRDALADVLEQTRREDAERAERDRHLVGCALAALAGVAAMPLLLGEMDADRLLAELRALPGPFGLLGRLMTFLHPWLVLLASVGAFTLLVVLGVALARSRRVQVEAGTDPVSVAGRALAPMRSLAAQSVASFDRARRGQRPTADERRRLEEGDLRAVELLDEVVARLEEADASGRNDIEEEMDAFLVRAEICARRPVPLPFPKAARRLRDVEASSISDDEILDVERAVSP